MVTQCSTTALCKKSQDILPYKFVFSSEFIEVYLHGSNRRKAFPDTSENDNHAFALHPKGWELSLIYLYIFISPSPSPWPCLYHRIDNIMCEFVYVSCSWHLCLFPTCIWKYHASESKLRHTIKKTDRSSITSHKIVQPPQQMLRCLHNTLRVGIMRIRKVMR